MFRFGDSEYPGVGKIVEESGELLRAIGSAVDSSSVDSVFGDLHRLSVLDELADLGAAVAFFVDSLADADRDRVLRASDEESGRMARVRGSLISATESAIGGVLQSIGRLMASSGSDLFFDGSDTRGSLLDGIAVLGATISAWDSLVSKSALAYLGERRASKFKLFHRFHAEAMEPSRRS